ncbi:MAG TPA: cob(I)yrinic acid a,c-diamide adenosyltransferase [Candidatus Thermoplasmatota archaeon]|nr:cob(I)yrinic acid a,c-diamide adenosyltransferase [Candidatus Thermoplasmatota archaeon]
MRIYTRGGDEGKTSLFDGTRVAKSDLRVEVYGTIDELNSHLSLCRVAATSPDVRRVLERVQNELFTCGADFATPTTASKAAKRLGAPHVEGLEKDTDRFFAEVGNPEGFVLPGETEAGARLHVARTVCRRAERLAVDLAARGPLNPEAIRYLNRLSSLLYALAVWSDKVQGGRKLQNPKYE